MRQIKSSIKIQAKPDQVWKFFSQFNEYPNWNPFIKKLEGKVEEGKTFNVEIQPPGNKPMTFKPIVKVLQKGAYLEWKGHLFMKGLFDGIHYFELIDNQDGSTTFIQGERFSGILVKPLLKIIGKDTQDGFEAMNLALKNLVETSTNN